ncbi:MAG: GvpL/GvpF family gas vesicle protein [Thermoleophilia bacterium]|nr:GvpL/GvpF family gas vesicle protein [Thermoleophilia bacterium]
MLYLYAIAEAGTAAPQAAGVSGAPLAVVEAGALAAICSVLDAAPEATEAAVVEHAGVVEAAAAGGSVLPVRFGTAFADAASLRRELADRESALRRALERVRGRVELGVRVLVAAAPRAPAADGRAYLLGRLDEQRRAAAIAEEVHRTLAQEAAAETFRVAPGPPLLLSAAYLVDADAVQRFRERVDELAAARPGVDVLCTGPWPPYSFAPADGGGE